LGCEMEWALALEGCLRRFLCSGDCSAATPPSITN
jgi:hypothetical protein